MLSKMEGFIGRLQKLCQTKTRRLVSVMGIIATILLVFHTFTLPFRIALSPLFPTFQIPVPEEVNSLSKGTSPKSMRAGKISLLTDSWNYTNPSVILKEVENAEVPDMEGETDHDFKIQQMYGYSEKDDSNHDNDLDEDGHPDSKISFEFWNGTVLKKVNDQLNELIIQEKVVDRKHILAPEKAGETISDFAFMSDNLSELDPTLVLKQITTPTNQSVSHPPASAPVVSYMNVRLQEVLGANSSDPASMNGAFIISSSGENKTDIVASSDQQGTETFLKNEALVPLQSGSATTDITSTVSRIPLVKEKQVMPPISILEMNRLLLRNHASYRSMGPRRYSSREKQILAAKAQIENAPLVKNDRELYAPIVRNISMFKRSYELMERMLKVYVYKDGQKPIFHQPLLKGIYASEGWFMKLMETNKHYVVKDPRKAYLFYMPFSSRLLQFALYVPKSHDHRNLEQYLKNYVDTIAAKYPFWNRTGGADHFLAACHDWAPYETRQAMKNSIRALCNADLSEGFELGKDVSLPEIYVRSAQNPLRDLGGMPANERPTLAFFAGNVHGRLRPILLEHWENKDPDMKIIGPMPKGVERKMAYIHNMKTSKYCICPRGYEVNSPRVVESIFYECVPVIISDNYVPPFFEVLNWEAFSVIIPEADVPRLKEILVSIPEEKYLSLQKGVRRVQQHFLWHSKPVKYDLFHMILHSIWFNRLYQIGTR